MSEILSQPLVAVIILLGTLVTVHELGHYLVGRWCGIAVEAFSIGFGPTILGFKHKETEYKLSIIPLGGYVKFFGMHPNESMLEDLEGRGYLQVKLWKRALTIFAGPFANFVLAVVIYMVLGMNGIKRPPAIIGDIMPNSAAAKAKLKYNDLIISINNKPVAYWSDIRKYVAKSPGQKIAIKVSRQGRTKQLYITPDSVETKDMFGKKITVGRVGISLGRISANISLQNENTLAFKLGFRTGDTVTAIQQGISRVTDISSYADLQKFFIETDYSDDITFSVRALNNQVRAIKLDLKENKIASFDNFLSNLGIRDSQLTIDTVLNKPLEQVLLRGDIIVSFAGIKVNNIFDLHQALQVNKEKLVNLTINRNGVIMVLKVSLKDNEVQRPEGKVVVYSLDTTFLGKMVDPEFITEKYSKLYPAFIYATSRMIKDSKSMISGLASLVMGKIPLKSLGGPLLIASVASESAKRGWMSFLVAMALISINLGVINLFPIPALDGGQLVLLSFEAFRRKPLSIATIENFQKIGFAMILALVVLAMYNDLSRFWTSMLKGVIGVFN